MASLAELIQSRRDEIVACWTAEAQKAASALGLGEPELSGLIPSFLNALSCGAKTEAHECIDRHVAARMRCGFELAEIVEEFALLEKCVSTTWASMGALPSLEERSELDETIRSSIVLVSRLFHEHMRVEEQREKRFLRLLQDIAAAALRSSAAPFGSKLRDVLEILLEATGAHSISLVVFDPDSGAILTKASVGTADHELEELAVSLDPRSLVGKIAASAEPTKVSDVQTTDLGVSDALRHSGIHSILGVRLPPGRRLVGVLYVGLRENRPFGAREISRLETLGAALTLHLDNAKLYADLRSRIEELGVERDLREHFVAILAHDLRGPLSAAKMTTQLLVRRPERLDARRDLAVRVERNLDRIDRMIRDLLDVSRVRAGERLPLRLDSCDLGSVAMEVLEELCATHGDRFELVAPETVRGIWSQEELRRGLWNLGVNAVKYGAPDTPITLRVERTAGGARVSVHNFGNPIAPEDQAKLFDFYAQLKRDARTSDGWGLGLALVRACAEAHGGNVAVESSVDAGTTFSIDLPSDARPFQATAPRTDGDAGIEPHPSSWH